MIHFYRTLEEIVEHLVDEEIVSICRSPEELGTVFRKRRLNYTSVQHLARKAQVGHVTISTVEGGSYRSTLRTYQKIAGGLGLEIAVLVLKQDNQFQSKARK